MSRPIPQATSQPIETPLNEAVMTALSEALRGVRYGTVTIIIQDGRIIQIDRTERRRLTSPAGS